jgi:hypothetical protein
VKNLGVYLTIPLVILALGVIFLLARIVPQGWRLRLLALAAFLLAAMPAQGEKPTVRCYEQDLVGSDVTNIGTQGLINTPEWASFRSAYILLLDYMAMAKSDGENYYQKITRSFNQKLMPNLEQAEVNLNKIIASKEVSQKTISAIYDGMNTSTTEFGSTCYRMVMTPEVERKFTLGEAVNRQVQLRKLILQNTIVASETIRLTRESIFVDIDKYLSGTDLEQYKTLMIDLLQVSD